MTIDEIMRRDYEQEMRDARLRANAIRRAKRRFDPEGDSVGLRDLLDLALSVACALAFVAGLVWLCCAASGIRWE